MFPSPPSFEELVQNSQIPSGDSGVSPGSLSSNDREHLETGWFFYLGEIALKRLTNRILLHRYESGNGAHKYTSQAEKDAQLERSISEFDLQLQQWYVHSISSPKYYRDQELTSPSKYAGSSLSHHPCAFPPPPPNPSTTSSAGSSAATRST